MSRNVCALYGIDWLTCARAMGEATIAKAIALPLAHARGVIIIQDTVNVSITEHCICHCRHAQSSVVDSDHR